jgi:hypothetical protein
MEPPYCDEHSIPSPAHLILSLSRYLLLSYTLEFCIFSSILPVATFVHLFVFSHTFSLLALQDG